MSESWGGWKRAKRVEPQQQQLSLPLSFSFSRSRFYVAPFAFIIFTAPATEKKDKEDKRKKKRLFTSFAQSEEEEAMARTDDLEKTWLQRELGGAKAAATDVVVEERMARAARRGAVLCVCWRNFRGG